MQKSLDKKLAMLANDPSADCFIIADAKDPDMARGVASAGRNADGHDPMVSRSCSLQIGSFGGSGPNGV